MIGRLSCDVGGATMRLCEHLHVQRQGCQFKLLSREGPMGVFSRSGTARHRVQDSPRHTRRRKGVASPWAFVRSTVQKRAYAGATARAACLHRGQSLIFTLTIPWRHMSTENLMLEPSRDACVTPNPPLSTVMYAAAAAAPRRETRLFDCAMQPAWAPQWIPFPLRLSAAVPEVRLD